MNPLRTALLALAAVTLAGTGVALAGRLPLGGSSELRCTQKGSIGLIVTSDRPVACVFYRPDGAVEFYTGTSNEIGVDLGNAFASTLAYRVLFKGPIRPAALQGHFTGPTFGATLGEGINAAVLEGGQQITLVPVAVKSYGLDLNGGLGALDLRYAGEEPSR